MTKIKICGLTVPEDVRIVNGLRPDYVGFVFFRGSRRCVDRKSAEELRSILDPRIQSVGVFVDEDIHVVAGLLESGIIQLAQLHGSEDDSYIRELRDMTNRPVMKAFRISSPSDAEMAGRSAADMILLDSGAGSGKVFEWASAGRIERPYFLAGGLTPGNVGQAIRTLHPYGVDVSSGVETEGKKDPIKTAAFAAAVRKEDEYDES